MNEAERLAKMCTLLELYAHAMSNGVPVKARDVAYEMQQIVTALYHDAYNAARVQARGEGKAL